MDVDYANNKGAYAITRVDKQMTLAVSDIISWGGFRKEDRQQTFGLLSQISPDGQVVVSTVKDKSVFVPTPSLAFSQLFFPIKGILAVYHRNSDTFQPLPGADDPNYVQSNPSWSPDGQYIIFARSQAYNLKSKDAQGKLLLSEEDCAEFLKEGKTFLFDLYRIPYNNGRGGKPEPLTGASRNGRSNFFAKYSPDGKWIVFCQAKSFMLLQPDSELYIIPAEGGEARRLRCNTARMNSWHSWSPNGRWLVFSSKAYSDYTQLFLTHMNDQGDSTPPVLLAHFTATNRAANIPEFVNVKPGAIEKIREQFLNDLSHTRAAYVFESTGDTDRAIAEYKKALDTNPRNVHAHQRLGFLLYNNQRQFEAGLAQTAEALRLDPNDACAHYDLGMALMHQAQFDAALPHLAQAVRLMPEGFDRRYNPADMQYALASAWIAKGDFTQAGAALLKAAAADPKKAEIQYTLALTLAAQGLIDEPLKAYTLARSLRPDLDTAPQFHDLMSLNYAKAGRYSEAFESAQKSLNLAQAGGQGDLARELRDRLESYRQSIAKP
jgi:tetratricopeptide (TPR) repeat protein